jgi:hypothetical protein
VLLPARGFQSSQPVLTAGRLRGTWVVDCTATAVMTSVFSNESLTPGTFIRSIALVTSSCPKSLYSILQVKHEHVRRVSGRISEAICHYAKATRTYLGAIASRDRGGAACS